MLYGRGCFLRIVAVATLFFFSTMHTHNQKLCADQNERKISLPLWSILTMIESDNNLEPFAELNVQSMKDGMVPTDDVNLLVVWDKPLENKTNRLKITAGTQSDWGSTLSELGFNTEKEIYD